MQVNQYIQEKFPHLEFKPPLFYNWNIGIRFEFGLEQKWKNNHPNSSYIRGIYNRYNDWILDYDRAAIEKVFD